MYDNYTRQFPPQPMTSGQAVMSASRNDFDIRAVLLMLWRRRWVVANTTILIIITAILITVQLTPRYSARALMAIETRKNSVVDLEAVMSGLGTDQAAIKTEIDVLKSRRLVGKLIDKLSLLEDPEFNGALVKRRSLTSYLNPLNYLPDTWRTAITGAKKVEVSVEERKEIERAHVIDNVLGRLTASNPLRSYTIELVFESPNPARAAQVVNSLMDIYLLDQLEVKFEATERANEWLNSRVYELREKVRASEQAAEKFREENQLVQTHAAGSVTEQQIAQLNSQLVTARTELSRARAREQQIGQNISSNAQSGAGLLEVLQSPLIQRLKEQESEVQRKQAELATRYGPKHPKMINVVAELGNIKSKIELEVDKIVASIRAEAEVADLRVKSLEKNLDSLKQENFELARAEVMMRELDREVAANQLLLQTFLTRFKETSSQDGLQQADTRIISKADKPTAPSFPKTRPMVLLAGFLGLGAGVAFAFLLEALDNGFRSFDQLQNDLGLRGLGMIPLIDKAKLKEQGPEKYLLSKPTSSFAEAHRSIYASLMLSNTNGITPKVIGVTSSVPGEGKSTAALCLAHMLALSGRKTLVVEADMRRPVLKKRIEIDTQNYFKLNDVLDVSGAAVKLPLYEDAISGAHIIWADRISDPQLLFETDAFEQFLDDARKTYDFVIVDTPPVLAVSDILVISRMIDALVFVIQWHKTPKGMVRSALKLLHQTDRPIAGAILTQVNVKRHQGYGYGDQGYYYGTKSGYYSN